MQISRSIRSKEVLKVTYLRRRSGSMSLKESSLISKLLCLEEKEPERVHYLECSSAVERTTGREHLVSLSSATSMRSLMAGLLPFLNRYWALTLKEE
jgi:hypothetical protein